MLDPNSRLEEAKKKIKKREGIGTLQEKTLHFILKNYYESDESKQEKKIGNYYADIFNGNEIIEIQTRQFNRLREKLNHFLALYPVTVVYPMIHEKYVYWVSPETGEISGGRKSPKKCTLTELFYELYKIKKELTHQNLHLKILILDIKEYKYLNGWSRDKKRGASKFDRIPLRIVNEISIDTIQDYQKLMPNLPNTFTSDIYAKCAGSSIRYARIALHVLSYLGLVKVIGKDDKKNLYQKTFK